MSDPISDSFAEFSSGLQDAVNEALGTPAQDTVPAETPAPAEPVDTAEETVAQDRPRDDKGRFVASDDPEIAKFLDKYNGDPEAAIKGALELQKLTSRQTDELGELRKLREQIEQMQESIPAPQAQIPGNLDELILNDPAQVAVWALQTGAGEPVFDAAMDEWFNQNPRQAARFETELRLQAALQEQQAQVAPLQQTLAQQQREAAMRDFQRTHPDIGDYTDQIQQIAQQRPAFAQMLASDDVETQMGALDALYVLAKASGPAAPPSGDTAQVVPDTPVEQALAGASILTGGTSGHTDPAAQKSVSDQLWDSWQGFDISRIQ